MNNSEQFMDTLTIIIFATVFILLGFGGYIVYNRVTGPPPPTPAVSTLAFLPTETPTRQVAPTLPPTFTPTYTPTITPSLTTTPSFTPSVSPTITDTPTYTASPVNSDTPVPTMTFTPSETSNVPTATPTATRPFFPFQLRSNTVTFTENTLNTAGCAYQAVGGQVLSLNRQGLNNIEVVVIDQVTGTDFSSTSGDSTNFGDGGYEVIVDSKINGKTYLIELRSQLGNVVSEQIQVTFPSNCDQNLALIYWEQTRPF